MPLFDAHTLIGTWPSGEADLRLETLAAGMQARQVTRALVTHTNSLFYDTPTGNAQCAEICGKHAPLDPVAVLDPLSYPGCLEEMKRRLDAGATVFRLAPREHAYPFSASVGPLTAVLKRLEAARLILVDLTGLDQPSVHADIIEHIQTPTAFTVDGRTLGIALHAAAMSPHVLLETSRLTGGGAIEAAVRRVGANRVIFGSGAPLYSLGSAVMSLQFAELTDADRASIFEGNLARILK